MELLAQVENRSFQVIFQTAFDEYAVQAFEANACDYLLKPYSQDRFNSAFDRAVENLGKQSSYDNIEAALHKRDGFLNKICAKIGSKTVLVPADDVLAFVSQDHYTTLIGRAHV